MIVLLADINIQGQVESMVDRMQAEPFVDLWNYLELSYISFADIGLDPSGSDDEIWNQCQEKRLILVTNNRNDEGPKSLETTIRSRNTPLSLPVFTIGDANRL